MQDAWISTGGTLQADRNPSTFIVWRLSAGMNDTKITDLPGQNAQ